MSAGIRGFIFRWIGGLSASPFTAPPIIVETMVIPSERRQFKVSAEQRTFTVPAETRTFKVKA